ncbi:MAG TPA: carboxypeptidase-like regulatory domain-containing protein [Steroidobacter sp.]
MSPSRSRRQFGKAALSTLFLSTLAACGGGGGGGGGGNSSPPPVTMSRLAITGTVTDAPIASAVVTATVSGQTFTANADANGSYRLELSLPETATGGFVTLTAKGVGSQSYVEFTSLAGTFQTLRTQAGSDEVLSSGENFATQITNVSTALAVLLQQANGGQPINSQTLLETLSAQLSSPDLLELATAIRLLVDEADDYPMPAGYTSLHALLANTAAREQLVTDAFEQDPEIFRSTQTAIVSDATLTRPVTSATLPRTLTAAVLPKDIASTYAYSDRVISYTFNPDGTGRASAGTWDADMTWSLAGSSVEISYASPVRVAAFERLICPDGRRGLSPNEYRLDYVVSGARLNLLNERVLTVTESREISFRDCGVAPAVETATAAFTILEDDDFRRIVVADLRAAPRTLGVYHFGRINADIVDWNANGTASTRIFGKQFTWALDTTGRGVTATFDDGTVGKYRLLRDVGDMATDVVQEFVLPTGRRIDAAPSVRIDTTHPYAFTAQNVPGRLYISGIGDERGLPTQKGPRWRLDANGFGASETDFVDQNGNIAVWNEFDDSTWGFQWRIDSEDLLVSYTLSTSSGQFNCVPDGVNCDAYGEIRVVPLMRIGTRIYWLSAVRAGLPLTDSAPINWSQVTFADYEPLGASAVVTGKSSPVGIVNSPIQPDSLVARQRLIYR